MTALRIGYASLGVALTGLAIFELVGNSTGLWQLVGFAALPDLALVLGIGADLERGQLHPRAVSLYNAFTASSAPLSSE